MRESDCISGAFTNFLLEVLNGTVVLGNVTGLQIRFLTVNFLPIA